MSKKSPKKTFKPLAADEPAKRPAADTPLDKPDQTSLSETVAAETQVVKPPAKTTSAQAPPHLLTPLAALWPTATLPEPPKSPTQAAGIAQAPKPHATKTVIVSFALLEPDAKQVALGGDFSGWASDAPRMKRKADGI